jgi:hypothetical protein
VEEQEGHVTPGREARDNRRDEGVKNAYIF